MRVSERHKKEKEDREERIVVRFNLQLQPQATQ